MNKIGNDKIKECIRGILSNADLKSISAKAIRIKLQEQLNEDFTNDKPVIDKLIMKLYNEQLSKFDDQSSELDDDDDVVIDRKRKAKTKIKREPKKRNIEVKISQNGDKAINNQDDKDSSDRSILNDDNDDAEIARALQAEMNGMRNVRKSTSLTSKKSKENKMNKKEKGPPRRVGGYCKIITLSEDLSKYLGTEKMPHHDVVKRFWDIAKERNMFDPSNRQFVLCDDDWVKLFGKKRFRMFSISKHLERHLIRD